MRNLKKVLSLALALVMLLGMMVVGAGAVTLGDYSDKAGINENYLEAVDLLTAIDVLSGSQGNFDPTGTLTREQAAKIVATLALGVDAAEALSTAVAPFSDVAANWWSAGYVAYCANMGIVSGIGGGKFAPAGEVSGYQFAKMLLGVLGYGVNDEYKGPNWVLNVSRDAQTVGVSKKVSISNDPLTREEAAQMAFNTIQLNLVSYSSLIGTYTAYAWNTGNATSGNNNQTLLGTLAKNIFDVSKRGVNDALHYSNHYWRKGNQVAAITGEYPSETVLGTVTSGTWGAMYRGYAWDPHVTVFENGNDMGIRNYNLGDNTPATNWTYSVRSDTGVGGFASNLLAGSNNKVVSYTGQYIDVIDTDGNGAADKLIIVTNYLGKVTKVTPAGGPSGRSVTVDVYVPNGNGPILGVSFETEDYEVGDYVLVTPDKTLSSIKGAANAVALKTAFGSVVKSAAAEKVAGATVNAYYVNTGKADGSVSVNGTKYSYNGVFANGTALGYAITSTSGSLYNLTKGTYNFYLDSFGNVIGVEEVEGAIGDFAYILAIQNNNAFGTRVKVLLSNGTVGIYQVSNRTDTSTVNLTVGSGEDKIYAYNIESNGDITLTALTGNYLTSCDATPNVDTITGFDRTGTRVSYATNGTPGVAYANDKTVFVYYYTGSNGMDKVAMFVGKDNAPDITNTPSAPKGALAAHHATGGYSDYADVVFVMAQPNSIMTNNYVYVKDTALKGYSLDVNNDAVYYYDVVLNGVTTRVATTNASLPTTGIYQYSTTTGLFNGDNVYGTVQDVYALSSYTATVTVSNIRVLAGAKSEVVLLNDNTPNQYRLTDSSLVIDATGPNAEKTTLRVGDSVTIVYDSNNGSTVLTVRAIYVTKRSTEVDETKIFNGGVYTIESDTYVNMVSGATLDLSNVTVKEGATLIVKGTVKLDPASNIKGTVIADKVEGTYTVPANAAVVTNTLAPSATITVDVGGSMTVNGTLTSDGNITVNAGGKLTVTGDIQNGVTISGPNTGVNGADVTVWGRDDR